MRAGSELLDEDWCGSKTSVRTGKLEPEMVGHALWHAFSKRTVTSLEIIWFCRGGRGTCEHRRRQYKSESRGCADLEFRIHLGDFF